MVPPGDAEVVSAGRPPAQEVLHQARRKAASLVTRFPNAVVLGSDTLISLDGAAIGKPNNREDSRAILRRLQGRVHEVVTAVVILYGGMTFEAVESVRVHMRDFTEAELESYLATGDSVDKAGAYSIQGPGASLIAGIDGDYLAVVGLPLRAVAEGLRRMGIPVSCDLDRLYRERAFLNWRTFN